MGIGRWVEVVGAEGLGKSTGIYTVIMVGCLKARYLMVDAYRTQNDK